MTRVLARFVSEALPKLGCELQELLRYEGTISPLILLIEHAGRRERGKFMELRF